MCFDIHILFKMEFILNPMSSTKTCYVIMPFSPTASTKNWDDVYQKLFKPVIEESKFGYKCERSQIRNGAFTKDIVQNLKTAYLVLADITDFNSNVMWELGVRHALSQRTIMVAREDMIEKIPADIRGYGVIAYPNDITAFAKFKEDITPILEKIEKEPERSDNPVFDFLKIEDIILTSVERKQIIGKLTSLLSELFDNLQTIEDVISDPPHVNSPIRLHRLLTIAIDELISTAYIPLDDLMQLRLKHLKYSFDQDSKLADQMLFSKTNYTDKSIERIKLAYAKNKKNIEEIIPILKKTLDSIKSGRFEFGESSIFMFREEHRKLLNME